ncbi:restriction endonuclease subunit S [Heyndrickxia sporothermodurans]|uniref:restriction endonuclease subunit S n=1 Tax=Heyndrickxia sporothermodurans TaxID=46224 RepID=UPI0015E71588|nr:restriction endonuclease subunit S [Heyndrickxia sporothermodurans]
MWIKVVNSKDLKQDGRWKVELFTTTDKQVESPYKMIKIKELVKERKENIKPFEFPDRPFNYIGLENVTPQTGELVNFNPKKGNEIKSTSKVFHEGDVLYARLRPYLNKVYLATANYEIEEGICSGEFHVLQPDTSKVLPNYLRTVLSSSYIQNYVKFMQTGSALPRLGIKDLMELEVPLPPLEVQSHFETFIINKIKRIATLKKELNSLPEMMISTVENSLESGAIEGGHNLEITV